MYGTKLYYGDITKNLPFEDNYFDIIIAVAVLEHILEKDLNKLLKEFNRVLKKNGLFIVEVPYKQRLNYALCLNCLAIFEKDEHLRSIDENYLDKLLSSYGFNKIKVRFFTPFNYKVGFKFFAVRIGFQN